MQVHILMFEDNIERASIDGRKMQELADEMNGGSPGFEIVGPYNVVSVELEDATLTSAMHSDGEGRCVHPKGYIKSVRICGLCGEQV